MKRSSLHIQKKLQKLTDFPINYVMESKTHYVLYGFSKGKGNNCDTLRIQKDSL